MRQRRFWSGIEDQPFKRLANRSRLAGQRQQGGAMGQGGQVMVAGAIALLGAVALVNPALAQTPTRANRAMFLIRNEAAIQLDTFPGDITVAEFRSLRDGDGVVGYEAFVQRENDPSTQLTCTVDLEDNVNCSLDDAMLDDVMPGVETECGIQRRQQTELEEQFVRLDAATDQAEFYVRIYFSIDDSTDSRKLCMSISDLREGTVRVLPARPSNSGTTAYYSDAEPRGISHQVIFDAQRNGYIYRQSTADDLLYQGYSR